MLVIIFFFWGECLHFSEFTLRKKMEKSVFSVIMYISVFFVALIALFFLPRQIEKSNP